MQQHHTETTKKIYKEHRENLPKNKIIGYVRSSTTEEKEYSFSPSSEVQKHLIKEKCLSKNVTLDKIYEDDSNGDQPQLQLLLEEIRLGDTLIVYSINRLSNKDQLCISNIFKFFEDESIFFDIIDIGMNKNAPYCNTIITAASAFIEFTYSNFIKIKDLTKRLENNQEI